MVKYGINYIEVALVTLKHTVTELKGRAASFKERDSNPEAYKKSRYALRRTIKQDKHQYRTKMNYIYIYI
jgi:hypothetical protein